MLYCKVTIIHIYTFTFFLYYLPSFSVPRDWREFPVLRSRTSLLIHAQCHSLHLPTPNAPSVPLPLGHRKSVLEVRGALLSHFHLFTLPLCENPVIISPAFSGPVSPSLPPFLSKRKGGENLNKMIQACVAGMFSFHPWLGLRESIKISAGGEKKDCFQLK